MPLLFLVVSCGPIIGQMMRLSEGVKSFRVVEGDLGILKQERKILVVGPFAKAPGAYYIARGDEAAAFAQELNNNPPLRADIYMGGRYGDLEATASAVRAMGGSRMQSELGISFAPDLIMTGTILERETIVAPTRGIIMQVGYRLEFFDPASKQKTVVEIVVKDHFKDCVKTVVGELLGTTAG